MCVCVCLSHGLWGATTEVFVSVLVMKQNAKGNVKITSDELSKASGFCVSSQCNLARTVPPSPPARHGGTAVGHRTLKH